MKQRQIIIHWGTDGIRRFQVWRIYEGTDVIATGTEESRGKARGAAKKVLRKIERDELITIGKGKS